MSTQVPPSRLDSTKDFSSLVPSAFGRANLAFAQANAAFAQANTGGGSSTDAYARDTANAGFITANSASSFANGSFLTANSASSFANGAFDRANASYGVANSGSSFANGAFDRANAAYNAANTATDSWVRTQANNAYDAANSSGSFANGAFTAANTSDGKAVSAGSFANGSFDRANSAFETANASSGTYATSAFAKANSANTLAQAGFDKANSANTLAQSGFNVSNAAFIQANAVFIQSNNQVWPQANAAFSAANSASLYANAAFAAANAATNGSSNTISIQTDKFVANGSTTTFNLSVTPLSENFVTAVVEGVIQLRDTYTVSSNVIYFDSTFENGAVVEITTLSGNSYLSGASSDTYARTTANAAFEKANTNLTAATAKSASGTAVDFTSIPSWVERITLMFALVSTNGNSFPLVQLGTGGSPTTSGYNSIGAALTASASGVSTSTAGFIMRNTAQSTTSVSGSVVFSNINGNRWVASGSFIDTQDSRMMWCSGQVDLSGTLDMLRVTTVNGSDSYDTGTINILYE